MNIKAIFGDIDAGQKEERTVKRLWWSNLCMLSIGKHSSVLPDVQLVYSATKLV